jgi:hypothetical protein
MVTTPRDWTPNLDKMIALRKNAREGRGPATEVQDFLDWLLDAYLYQGEHRVVLGTYVEGEGIYGEQPVEIHVSRERLLAEFFGVDLVAAERERMAVLQNIRNTQC